MFRIAVLLFSFPGIAVGIFLVLKPGAGIEIQRRFYEKINWRLEPISMPKELRNTKAMGLLLAFVSLLAMAVGFFGM